MRKAFLQLFISACTVNAVLCQVPKPTAYFTESDLVVNLNGSGPLPATFNPLDAGQYKVYLLHDQDTPDVGATEITNHVIAYCQECLTFSEFNQEVRLRLKGEARTSLIPGNTYFVQIANYPTTSHKGLTAKTEIAVQLLGSADINHPQESLQIASPIPLSILGKPLAKNSAIEVQRTRKKVKNDDLVDVHEKLKGSISDITDNVYSVSLCNTLDENTVNEVSIPGLVDRNNRQVKSKGTIEIAGAPVDEKDAYINLSLASTAAVHQAPVFTLAGTFAPLHRLTSPVGIWGFIWDPAIKVDVGLRSTKAANSVYFTNTFRHSFPFAVSGTPSPGNKIPTFFKSRHSGLLDLSDIVLGLGLPKFEVDRDFHRLNAVAQLRTDFGFYRWKQSIADQRRYLAIDLNDKKAANQVAGVAFGLSAIPYAMLEIGGHIVNETVTNTKVSGHPFVVVPGHPILRGYAGINLELDIYRFAFTLDEALLGLAHKEIIGYTTSSGVATREVEGIQHHAKASFDLAIDPGRHYHFTVGYENGRSAPNFEYLNKVDTGLKVLF